MPTPLLRQRYEEMLLLFHEANKNDRSRRKRYYNREWTRELMETKEEGEHPTVPGRTCIIHSCDVHEQKLISAEVLRFILQLPFLTIVLCKLCFIEFNWNIFASFIRCLVIANQRKFAGLSLPQTIPQSEHHNRTKIILLLANMK